MHALTYNYVIVKGLRGAGDRTKRGGGDRTRRGGGDRKGKESDWKRVEIS